MAPDPPDLTKHSARDILGHSRVVDAVIPPIIFVTAYGFTGLAPAAIAALAASAVLVVIRLIRREDVVGAFGGIVGTGIAVGFALLSGRAENYFLPRVISNAAFAVGLIATIVAGRPAVGLVAQLLYRFPEEWLARPEVRKVFALATWPFVGLCVLRATVYLILIDAGEVGWLAVVTTILGWPSFAALLIATYAFVRRRMARMEALAPPEGESVPVGP
jgi:intracellular septation protein A